MKKLLLGLTIIFSLTSNYCFSQTSIQLIGGSANAFFLSSMQNMGFNAGALIDFKLKGNISLQTGLNISSYEEELNWGVPNYFNNISTFDEGWIKTYHFIEVPLSIAYSKNINSKTIWKFNGGTYLAFFGGGKTLYRSSNGFSEYILSINHVDKVHLGFLLGSGIEINRVYVGIEGNYNATDVLAAEWLMKTKFGIKF